MRRGCLSEVALARMHAGLGTPPQSAHVTRCERCAAHYRGLIRDLELITGVLMDTAIAHTLRARLRHTLPWRRLVFTSAIATMLVIAVTVGGPRWRSSTPVPPATPAGPTLVPPATPGRPAPLGVTISGVTISMDPDALVGEPSPGADEGCATGDDQTVAVGCQDDGGADTDAALDVG